MKIEEYQIVVLPNCCGICAYSGLMVDYQDDVVMVCRVNNESEITPNGLCPKFASLPYAAQTGESVEAESQHISWINPRTAMNIMIADMKTDSYHQDIHRAAAFLVGQGKGDAIYETHYGSGVTVWIDLDESPILNPVWSYSPLRVPRIDTDTVVEMLTTGQLAVLDAFRSPLLQEPRTVDDIMRILDTDDRDAVAMDLRILWIFGILEKRVVERITYEVKDEYEERIAAQRG